MYQAEGIIAVPRNKNILRGPSKSPKGMGRKIPHCGRFTRKTSQTFDHSIAISDGLDKINMFLFGKKIKRKPVIPKLNPFKKMMDLILKFTK